jgi:hypothetical protein
VTRTGVVERRQKRGDFFLLHVRWRDGSRDWVVVSRSEWSRTREGTEVEVMEDARG